MIMEQSKIERINFLAKKQKGDGLTPEEKEEQVILRREYIDSFKRNLVANLENTYIVDENGNKHKVKKHTDDDKSWLELSALGVWALNIRLKRQITWLDRYI